jgi:heptosyltransferase-2
VQKFLIIQTAFIGDVVLATSLVEKLQLNFPDSQIDFLLRKGNESLLWDHPFLHEVLVWDKQKGKLRNLWKLLIAIRKREYDVVINVQRFGATGFLTACSGAGQKIGFDKNPFSLFFTKRITHQNVGEHEIQRNNELIRGITDATVLRPKLYPSARDMEKVVQYQTDKYITVAPASVWYTKQYPQEKWVSFINKVPENIIVYLLGSPADQDCCASIAGSVNAKQAISLCGRLSFLESCALMKNARMNYVNDSAPMHFASAVNAPVTAVYCSTIPAFGYGPLSDKKFIVEIKEDLYCRPCGLHGFSACPEKHFNCAMKISDEQLIETLPR